MAIFVIHEHHASHLHYDMRLEIDGVLKSWAVPKGPSMDPKDKRLAIMVDDHPMEYATFEGIIPQGLYGAGAVVIWDDGALTIKSGSIREGRLEIHLNGTILKGDFVFMKLKGKEKEWLLIKKRDEYAINGFKIITKLNESIKKRLKERIPPCQTS